MNTEILHFGHLEAEKIEFEVGIEFWKMAIFKFFLLFMEADI